MSISVVPGRAPSRISPGNLLEGRVVGEHRDADVRALQDLVGAVEDIRAARRQRLGALARAVVHREREAGVEDPVGERPAHLAEADERSLHVFHPPSASSSTPFTAPFSSRKIDASTISSIVTSRPMSVFERWYSRTASGLDAHSGLSPTTPGWIALTRIGASC